MKFSMTACLGLSLTSFGHAFVPLSNHRRHYDSSTTIRPTKLFQSSPLPNNMNKDMMKAAADQMKNLKPEDIDKMVTEMDQMNPLQKSALQAMGMNPDTMKQTMKMMRDNPEMVKSAQEMMENLTPEQLMEQSKLAQEQLKTMTPEQLEEQSKVISQIPKETIDEAVSVLKQQQQAGTTKTDDDEDEDDDIERPTGPGTSSDPNVIQSMYQVAQFLSDPNQDNEYQGVTLSGFAALPVIQLLRGDREQDLSLAELQDCWSTGSLGATRVDQEGFQRVWTEVQDYFEDDIIGEARKEAKTLVTSSKKKRGTAATPAAASPTPAVGENLSAEDLQALNKQVENLSDDDISQALESMQQIGPAEEARMKAMGVDPAMMKKTAEMMQNNPMMRKAAQTMMSKMSPEQMLKMSQQAQEQMKNMTPEEVEQAMKNNPLLGNDNKK